MYGAIISLIISLGMIGLVWYKGQSCGETIYCLKKAEAIFLLDSVPDDCIVQIRIGRSTYGFKGTDLPRGGNLRNNISERR